MTCPAHLAKVHARQRAEHEKRKAQLAELMAEGCPSLAQAGQRMGISQQRASQLWKKVVADLGWVG